MRQARAYDDAFFSDQAGDSSAGARAIVPTVVDLLRPASVLDVGCGVGAWLAAFEAAGVEDSAGVDGAYVDRSRLLITPERFRPADLSEPLDLGRRFDLVVSLEVAEHIPPARADTFVDSVARHGDLVLFSAAIPRQAGTHHVNLRWPSYWAAKFAERDFVVFDPIRPRFWRDGRIPVWFRQNIVLFARAEAIDRAAAIPSTPGPLDIAHPEMYEAEPGLRDVVGRLGPAARAAVRTRLRGSGRVL